MTPVGMNNASTLYSQQTAATTEQPAQALTTTGAETAVKAENGQVVYTKDGKAILDQLAEKDKQLANADGEEISAEESETSGITSFAYGAIGLDHPDEVEQVDDSSYTAGQFVKGALSVGAILLAIA